MKAVPTCVMTFIHTPISINMINKWFTHLVDTPEEVRCFARVSRAFVQIYSQFGRGPARGKQLLLTYNDPKSAKTNFLGFGTGPDATAIWIFLETYGMRYLSPITLCLQNWKTFIFLM